MGNPFDKVPNSAKDAAASKPKRSFGDFVADCLEKYRVPLLAICLPLSFLYTKFQTFLKWFRRRYSNIYNAKSSGKADKSGEGPSPEFVLQQHDARVDQISFLLQQRFKIPADCRPKIVPGRPTVDSLQVGFKDKSDKFRVPTDELHNILALDEENLTVHVEPMVSVEDAAKFLIPRGYILESHLEYGRATLGGLALAVGMTTHAHHSGLYQESIKRWEVVLGDGTILNNITADNQYSDLFHALPWSHGTLGILVGLELKVIKIQPYIRLKYIPVKGASTQEIGDKIRDHCGALDAAKNKKSPAFCEATLFDENNGVIIVGDFDDGTPKPEKGDVDNMAPPINRLGQYWKPWWFKHVEGILYPNGISSGNSSKSKKDDDDSEAHPQAVEELIPIYDYMLRHHRSIFWVIELMVPYGNHPIFRYLFGWLLPLDVTFMKLTTTSGVRKLTYQKQVFQDITFPMTDLEEAVQLSSKCFDIWPLLIYPCKEFSATHGGGKGQLRPPKPHQLCPNDKSWGMFFDLGIYGAPGYLTKRSAAKDHGNKVPKEGEKFAYNPSRAMRTFTDFVRKVGGHPFLYADQFCTESEFEEMFDLTAWRKVRDKYKASENFPTLWEKVRPEVDVITEGDRWI